jgi:hypothetical protein
MGKTEVLGFLLAKRMVGEHGFFQCKEIHDGMVLVGFDTSYTSTWRAVNGLYFDKLLEVQVDRSKPFHRTARFRAVLPSDFHSSPMKREYNIHRRMEHESPSAPSGVVRASARPALRGAEW